MSAPFEVPLASISACFQGVFPAEICSVARDGTPNVTPLSIVHQVDDEHVALSFQFFNKTRRNVLENPRVQVLVVDPETYREYRLDLKYLRTETEGPLFERMRIRLDAVASSEGVERVFHLRGADVYRVLACAPVAAYEQPLPAERSVAEARLLEEYGRRLVADSDLDGLLAVAVRALADVFGYERSLLFLPEADGMLRARAAHGLSRACSDRVARNGEGAVGMAGERRAPVRLGNVQADVAYLRAEREHAARAGFAGAVPSPGRRGRPEVQSQLAIPLVAADRLQGVLALESSQPGRFDECDERLLTVAGQQLAWAIAAMGPRRTPVAQAAEPGTVAGRVRYYHADDSVFLDDEYLIKGMAGRILWWLLEHHAREGRTEFANRELRLHLTSPSSPVKDNLETRLLLLQRRLDERDSWLRIVKTGRGRFRLRVDRPAELQEIRG